MRSEDARREIRDWIVIGILMLVLTVGCYMEPIRQETPKAQQAGVSQIFEHQGCRVYRFWDGGYPRYYTKCACISKAEWVEKCGDSCFTNLENQTYNTEETPW